MSVLYITRIIDKGTRSEARITWEGPFHVTSDAIDKLHILQEMQPQFDFVIEVKNKSGFVRDL